MTAPHSLTKGDLWSWLRQVIDQGRMIQMDDLQHKFETYEHLVVRMDEAASERCDELWPLIDAAVTSQNAQDAARYRYIRSAHERQPDEMSKRVWLAGDELDAAIDAAMKEPGRG